MEAFLASCVIMKPGSLPVSAAEEEEAEEAVQGESVKDDD